MVAAALPDLDSLDLEAMKALMIAQHKRYTATLTSRTSEVGRLVLLVEKLQRMLFGAKSEKVLRQIEQLQFEFEDLQVASSIEELQTVAPVERPGPAKPFRPPARSSSARAPYAFTRTRCLSRLRRRAQRTRRRLR